MTCLGEYFYRAYDIPYQYFQIKIVVHYHESVRYAMRCSPPFASYDSLPLSIMYRLVYHCMSLLLQQVDYFAPIIHIYFVKASHIMRNASKSDLSLWLKTCIAKRLEFELIGSIPALGVFTSHTNLRDFSPIYKTCSLSVVSSRRSTHLYHLFPPAISTQ